MTGDLFFRELNRIMQLYPKMPLKIFNSENCEYGDNLYYSKNLFNSFDCVNCTDSSYLFDSYLCANSWDSDYAVESQLCYESVDPFKCFNGDFLEYCSNLRDSAYCYWCFGGSNLFGCVNLKNKSFCIFNRQLTEAEYRDKIAKFKSLPPQQVLAYVEQLKKRYPLTQTIEAHNENTTYGNYIHYDKNCYLCFDAAHDEECSYVYDTFYCKNCMDTTYTGQNVELCYEVLDSASSFNCNYAILSEKCQDSAYIINCTDVKNCLGCVNLTHKQYCILNRQLSQADYDRLAPQILEQLKSQNANWDSLQF